MKYAIIEEGVVVQVQPNDDERTIKVPDDILPGYLYEGGQFSAPAGPSVDEQKLSAKTSIDQAAEVARMSFVTPGAGQQAVYTEKGDQARQAAAEADPDPDDYPLLKASIGIEGDTLADVIAVVEATRTAWLGVAALIEAARLGGKKNVTAAEDAAGVTSARDTALKTLAAIRPAE